jgi:hypothetical protein
MYLDGRRTMRWTSLLTKSVRLAQTVSALALTIAATPVITETLFGWRWT